MAGRPKPAPPEESVDAANRGAGPAWMRRRVAASEPITARSIALFRLGEICNNACPMCSNSGRPAAFLTPTATLLDRANWLHAQGIRRVVLTGGEPTIHPGFWQVVDRLNELGLTWDINSHGRSFASSDFAWRAIAEGLQRAIISLHSHDAEIALQISGVRAGAHDQTVSGVRNLVEGGVWVMLNCVISRLNIASLGEWVRWCADEFGDGIVLKIAFPTTIGHGGEWPEIHLPLDALADPIAAVRAAADETGVRVAWESVPNCVLGDVAAGDFSRSGFGETHYLDDLVGDRLYPIRHIEAELSVYPTTCRGCRALTVCPGVSPAYVNEFGTAALRPFAPIG